jgi:hypothetical protein
MLKSTRAKVFVVVIAVALIVAGSVAVLSQQNPPPYPNMQGGQGQPGMGPQGQPGMPGQGQGQMGPGGYGGGGMGMQMMGRGNSVAIAATSEYVYVVQGTTLYQFSAKTLKQENKAELSTSGTRNQTPNQ